MENTNPIIKLLEDLMTDMIKDCEAVPKEKAESDCKHDIISAIASYAMQFNGKIAVELANRHVPEDLTEKVFNLIKSTVDTAVAVIRNENKDIDKTDKEDKKTNPDYQAGYMDAMNALKKDTDKKKDDYIEELKNFFDKL